MMQTIILIALAVSIVSAIPQKALYQEVQSAVSSSKCQTFMINNELNVQEYTCVNDLLILNYSKQSKILKLFSVQDEQLKEYLLELLDISTALSQGMDWYIQGKIKELEYDNKQRRLRSFPIINELPLNNSEAIEYPQVERLRLFYIQFLQEYILFDTATKSTYHSKDRIDILNLINLISQCKQFTFAQSVIQHNKQVAAVCDNKLSYNIDHIVEEHHKRFLTELGEDYKLSILVNNKVVVYNKKKICNLLEQCFYIDNQYQIQEIKGLNEQQFEIYLTFKDQNEIKKYIYIPYHIFQQRIFQNDCVVCNDFRSPDCLNDCLNKLTNNQMMTYYNQILQYATYTIVIIIILVTVASAFLYKKENKYFKEIMDNANIPKPSFMMPSPKLELCTLQSESAKLTS